MDVFFYYAENIAGGVSCIIRKSVAENRIGAAKGTVPEQWGEGDREPEVARDCRGKEAGQAGNINFSFSPLYRQTIVMIQ